jgi:hypothetical protein
MIVLGIPPFKLLGEFLEILVFRLSKSPIKILFVVLANK